MQKIRVKELAVPLSDYATVSEGATLAEAILALQLAQNGFDPKRPKHRAILVLNNRQQVIGKVGYLQVLRGLEPRYKEVQPVEHMGGTFTAEFIKSMLEKNALWQQPLADLCRKAAKARVKGFIHVPRESEFIDEEATLDEAVHQFITIREQSLLIQREGQVVGILRLSDVVEKICGMIMECNL